MMLFLASTALAAPVWWTEDGITSNSAQFGKAQTRDAEAFETAQGELERAKQLVGDVELGAALLGNPAELKTYSDGLDKSLTGQFLRLQRHADLLGGDYSRVFGAAVERALPAVAGGQTVTECNQRSKIEMMMGRAARCEGTDISKKLAAAIDADTLLIAAVTDILSVPWPSIQVTGAAQAPLALTGAAVSIDAASVARVLRPEELRQLDDDRDVALEGLEEELSSSDRTVKEAAVKKAAAVRATWQTEVGALGGKLWPEVKKKLAAGAKKGGPAAVALCANPAGLGGCGVPDATSDALKLLAPDRE